MHCTRVAAAVYPSTPCPDRARYQLCCIYVRNVLDQCGRNRIRRRLGGELLPHAGLAPDPSRTGATLGALAGGEAKIAALAGGIAVRSRGIFAHCNEHHERPELASGPG